MIEETLEPASLRLPTHLLATIRKRAKVNRRSVNAEATVLLEERIAEIEAKAGEAA
mgnify:CR=1 FL=1